MAKDTAIAVNASVRTLAGELKAALKLNEGKVAMNDDAYEQHLTANGLTLEQVRNAQSADNVFIAATTLAVSELADQAMRDASTLNQVGMETNMGHNSLKVLVSRPEGEGENRPMSVTSAYSVVDHTNDIRAVTDHLTHLWLNAKI